MFYFRKSEFEHAVQTKSSRARVKKNKTKKSVVNIFFKPCRFKTTVFLQESAKCQTVTLFIQLCYRLPGCCHQKSQQSCSLCSCSVDPKQNQITKRKSPIWPKKVTKKSVNYTRPLANSDRVYLQVRSIAWGVRPWPGWSNWRRDTRREREAQVA